MVSRFGAPCFFVLGCLDVNVALRGWIVSHLNCLPSSCVFVCFILLYILPGLSFV